MLLDVLLPEYDFTEVHSILVKSSPETAYNAIMETTLQEISSFVRFLFFLRELPERAMGRKGWIMNKRQPLLSHMFEGGFARLAEQESREIVFGIIVPGSIGRVWQKSSGLQVNPASSVEFFAFNNPQYLQVVANMLVEDAAEPGFVTIRTESRTRALSSQSRKDFRLYWWIIRPFSGLIRRLWLRGIRKQAEISSQNNGSRKHLADHS